MITLSGDEFAAIMDAQPARIREQSLRAGAMILGVCEMLSRDTPEPEPPTAAEGAAARIHYMRHYTPDGKRRLRALPDLVGVDAAAYRW